MWFVYVFYPIPEGQKLPITSVEPLEVRSNGEIFPDARAVKVSFEDGTTHYFMQADRGGELLEFADFSTDAEAILIQVGPDGKVETAIEVREQ